jgi:hypothetical protein
MRADDFDTIEKSLSIVLPDQYRSVLTQYPFPPDPDSSSLWLVDDHETVIETTKTFRANQGTRGPWPLDYVYLGNDGGEEAYFLDVSRTPAPVLTYEYETGAIRPQAPDLAAWIDELRDRLVEIAADERYMAERKQAKKWWQFWR